MSETSKNFNHDYHIKTAIGTEAPTTSGGTPSPEAQGKKKISLKNRILLGTTGVVLTAIAGTGVGFAVSSQGHKPPEATTSSAPATPEASASPIITAETFTVQSLEIPSTSSPEQIAAAYSDRITKYYMANANPASHKERLAYQNGTANDFATEKAVKDAAIFNEALFVKGFESDTNMAKYASIWQQMNATTAEYYIITHNSGEPLDKEPFAMSLTTSSEKVISQDTNNIVMQIISVNHNNSEMNRIGSQYDTHAVSLNDGESVANVTFSNVDGSYKISALDIIDEAPIIK